jgi:large conductance mechanosensitive channel
MGMWQEFMDFIKKQNVVAVALGLITGFAAKDLVDALIKDIITPIYSPYIAFLNTTASVAIGQSEFMVGDFIQSLISFLVILIVVFIIAKKMAKTTV